MGLVVGFGSQKGGSGKTTCATGLAVFVAENKWSVQVGDLDEVQQTATEWAGRRALLKHEPPIDVRVMKPEAIAKARELVELLVLDLPGRADNLIFDVARDCDLLVVITGTNLFELDPTIAILDRLKAQGKAQGELLEWPRVVVALNGVRDERREDEARDYLKLKGYKALPNALPDYTSIYDVGNEGRGASEIGYPDVADATKKFFTGVMNALRSAAELTRKGSSATPAMARGGRRR